MPERVWYQCVLGSAWVGSVRWREWMSGCGQLRRTSAHQARFGMKCVREAKSAALRSAMLRRRQGQMPMQMQEQRPRRTQRNAKANAKERKGSMRLLFATLRMTRVWLAWWRCEMRQQRMVRRVFLQAFLARLRWRKRLGRM